MEKKVFVLSCVTAVKECVVFGYLFSVSLLDQCDSGYVQREHSQTVWDYVKSFQNLLLVFRNQKTLNTKYTLSNVFPEFYHPDTNVFDLGVLPEISGLFPPN